MRFARLLASLALFGAGLAAGFRAASAKDETPPPAPSKAISHPFADAFLGAWATELTAEGTKGAGHANVERGVGGTALVERYEGPGGAGPYHALAVYKFGADGKSLACWWFDDLLDEPIVLSGGVTEKGFDLYGAVPDGSGKYHATLDKVGGGWSNKVYVDEKLVQSEEYRRPPAK